MSQDSVRSSESNRTGRSSSISTDGAGPAAPSSTSSTPLVMRKKRMSMNFAALPVVVSSDDTVKSPGSAGRSPGNKNVVLSGNGGVSDGSPYFARAARVSSPTRVGNEVLGNSAAEADGVNYYLGALASKERRVVELKDELKRVQEELERAESELYELRNEANNVLQIPKRNAVPAAPALTSSKPGRDSSSLDGGRPPAPRPVYAHAHGNVAAINGASAAAAANAGLRSRTQFDSAKDDVVNMGRRVVEGIHSQFWDFVQDIKSAAIGDVPRAADHGRPGIQSQSTQQPQQQHRNQNLPQQDEPNNQRNQQQPARKEHARAASNSYYML